MNIDKAKYKILFDKNKDSSLAYQISQYKEYGFADEELYSILLAFYQDIISDSYNFCHESWINGLLVTFIDILSQNITLNKNNETELLLILFQLYNTQQFEEFNNKMVLEKQINMLESKVTQLEQMYIKLEADIQLKLDELKFKINQGVN